MTKSRDLLAALCLSLLIIAIFGPNLSSGLMLINDHQIIKASSSGSIHPQALSRLSFFDQLTREEPSIGRFRPFYIVVIRVLFRTLRDTPLSWYVLNIVLALGTALLCYAALRVAGASILPAAIFGATVVLTPLPARVWVWLQLPETYGMLGAGLTLLLVACAARKSVPSWWDIALLVVAGLTALLKESFVLILPALAYARIALWQHHTRRHWIVALRIHLPVIVGLALICVGALGATIATVRANPASYGGQSLIRIDSLTSVGQLIVQAFTLQPGFWPLPQAAGFVPVAMMLLALILGRRTSGDLATVFHSIVFCLLWTAPQLILMATRPGALPHYWQPAILGLALANGLALAWLAYRGPRPIYLIATTFMLGWLAYSGFTVQRDTVLPYRDDTHALQQALDDIATFVDQGQPVVIFAHPVGHYEQSISMIYHLGRKGRADIPVYLLLSQIDFPPGPLRDLTTSLFSGPFANHDARIDIAPSQAAAVVLFSNAQSLPCPWYNELRSSFEIYQYGPLIYSPPVIMFRSAKPVSTPLPARPDC